MKRRTFTFFVGPSIFIMLALMTVPLLASIVLGMHYITFRNLDEPLWVGFQNYQEVLGDPEFWGFAGIHAALHRRRRATSHPPWLDVCLAS